MPQPDIQVVIKIGVYLLACIIAHWPSNWLIGKIIKRWKPAQNEPEEPNDKMGAFIGTLERVLIILLVGLEVLTAVGFVVTMKSIARYEKIQSIRRIFSRWDFVKRVTRPDPGAYRREICR